MTVFWSAISMVGVCWGFRHQTCMVKGLTRPSYTHCWRVHPPWAAPCEVSWLHNKVTLLLSLLRRDRHHNSHGWWRSLSGKLKTQVIFCIWTFACNSQFYHLQHQLTSVKVWTSCNSKRSSVVPGESQDFHPDIINAGIACCVVCWVHCQRRRLYLWLFYDGFLNTGIKWWNYREMLCLPFWDNYSRFLASYCICG